MNGNTEQISTPPSLHFDLGEMGAGGGHGHTTSAWFVLLPAAEGRKDGEALGISKCSSASPQKYLFWVQKEPSAIWRDPPLIKSFKGLN